MSVLKLLLLADLQQKVLLSITSYPTIITLEKTLNYYIEKNVFMVTFTTGIMCLLFTCMHF
jgi:hypothetical protein